MNLGTLIDGLGCFPFERGTYLPRSDCRDLALPGFGVRLHSVPLGAAIMHSVLYPRGPIATLALKLFRGEPAIPRLDCNFSTIHSSSAGIATNVGSDLRRILLRFRPGHG